MKSSLSTVLLASIASTTIAATATSTIDPAEGQKFFLVAQFYGQSTNYNPAAGSFCVSPHPKNNEQASNIVKNCQSQESELYSFKGGKIFYDGSTTRPGTTWTLAADPGLLSDSWWDVTWNAKASGTEMTYSLSMGFMHKGNDTQSENGLRFIACRWAHNLNWQLFALTKDGATPIPTNCEIVRLYRGCSYRSSGCAKNPF
ncbi:uncharacterized protein B0I36DRAFT_358611 [Microdochium trichocladiopsis]|uniref:DUF7907 domain-containing protein n=1 Tax=Microdochium trichocladiopsis TaxID=1682393 RepID=A0A9P9BX42_9PEZI|nr:uncharacterized protein B0I36DRAFT_358611 [Microdochium trichocladiopsis]KAH7041442.1 hypothetical protein B0I36DRAFT_358611 [Microdochium trichocladiopsis]